MLDVTVVGWSATIGLVVVLFAIESLLKSRRAPEARAHAGSLRDTRVDRRNGTKEE